LIIGLGVGIPLFSVVDNYTHNTMINPTMMKNNGIPMPRPRINSKLSTTEKI
jgi:hypothetical protein